LRRIAWIMVLTMTVLLVLAFLAVAYGVVRQGRLMAERQEAASPAAAVPANALASLTLAPGVRIVSAQAGGGKLVLHLTGAAGDEVQVIDMASGALVQQVRTQK
jgi:hypothetical protein